MVGLASAVLVFSLAAVAAHPAEDSVISKLGSELRYQYQRGPDGVPHLVDRWLKRSDVAETARYNPDLENVYHLFTRANPTVSQPLLPGNYALLSSSNFDPNRRTIYLIHGWIDDVTANFNRVLVPAFLEAADVNVIAVNWGAGAFATGEAASLNSISSGESGARFINWLNSVTRASPADYHIVGYSLGAHQTGVVGRNVDGDIGYITPLDPANGWAGNEHIFRPDDAMYTEAIHTNAGVLGLGLPVAHVDFFPNGGINMPGCTNIGCDHDRAYFYFAESLTSGGFTGRECATLEDARAGTCDLPGTLQMGGLTPKTGSTGLYHLDTNASPPFSQG